MNVIFENISILDLVTVTLVIASSLWGYFRGFFRELFTLGVWLLAGWAAVYFQQQILQLAVQYFPTVPYLELMVLPLSFIVFFLLFNLLVTPLSKLMREFAPKILDRSLGFLFGFARAVALLGLLWIAFLIITEPENFYRELVSGFTVDFVHACARATQWGLVEIVKVLGIEQNADVEQFFKMINDVIIKFESNASGINI